MKAPQLWIANGLLCAALVTPEARAFCRTRTCDPIKDGCRIDSNGCIDDGAPLWWPNGNAPFWVAQEGSPGNGITAANTVRALEIALDQWANALCSDGAPPDINVSVEGDLVGATVNFNIDNLSKNLNVVVFREADWEHDASAVAVTSTTFDVRNGQILDSDTELNAYVHTFSVNPTRGEVDLLAVLTHEAGHALGLDHTTVPNATMQPETHSYNFIELRSLEQDDVDGICSIYGPGSGGDDDGCSMGRAGGASRGWAWLAGLAMIAGVRRRARHSRLSNQS